MTKIINKIVEFDPFEANLTEFKEQYKGIVYDFDDPTQEKAAKSDKIAIGKVISSLDKAHKDVKADVLARTKLIDGERKRIKDQLLEIQGDIKAQIEEHEQKAFKHAAMLHAKVEAISAFGEFDELPDSNVYKLKVFNKALSDVNSVVIDSTFEAREADAALAKMKTVELLEGKIARTENLIKEQKEAEKKAEEKRIKEQKEAEKKAEEKRIKEQKERDEQIRKEAEEKAAREAKEAAERAEKEKEEAIERERIKAEKAVKEAEERAEKIRLAEIAKRESEEKAAKEAEEKAAKELKKKQENQKHRASIHKAIKESFIKNGFSEEMAVNTTNLLKDGKIKNVTVEY